MGARAVLAVVAGGIMGPAVAGLVVGVWRLVSNGLGLAGEPRRRVATARDASEG